MDRIDTIASIVGVLVFAHFCESLYLSLCMLLSNKRIAAPHLPDTLLPTLIRDVATFRQTEEDYFATLGQPRVVGRSIPHFDISTYVGYGGTVGWPSPTLNKRLSTMSPHALELQNGCTLQPPLSTNPGFVARASAWMAALQAILGIAVTLTTSILQAIKVDNCRPLTILVVVAFATGMALIILAYVAQAYAINGKLTKVAAATIAGASLHFIVLATFTAYALPGGKIVYTTACLPALKPVAKWTTYLPAVSSAVMMLVSVALLILCLFAACQLQSKLKCSIFRELYNTMRIYRGIGCMFVSGLLSASISIVILVLAVVGGFDIGLCWLVQWATMSRMLTTSLWHRLHTDSTAHKHKFWRSYAYYSGYLRYHRDTDNIFTTRTQ